MNGYSECSHCITNAAKHAYWAYRITILNGRDEAVESLEIHEALVHGFDYSNDDLARRITHMDLINNMVGVEMAESNQSLTNSEAWAVFITAANQGKLCHVNAANDRLSGNCGQFFGNPPN